MDLLHDAAESLPVDVQTENQLRDGKNRPIAWVAFDGDERYVLVAKEYAHRQKASFMESLVSKAASAGANLLFYSADESEYYVFDSEFYLDHGIGSTGASRREDDVKWLERPLEDAVTLDEYLNGSNPVVNLEAKTRPEKTLTNW